MPSIIDGACDRLRPVLLTTMTTVLGLAPLLFERSQQAQFLKPTVVTLVYGLGFGLVLVLLVVPALLAMQKDISHMARACRRALRLEVLRLPMWLALKATGGWLVATVGWQIATGAAHPALAGMVFGPPRLGPLMLFILGAWAISLAVYAVSVLVYLLRIWRLRET